MSEQSEAPKKIWLEYTPHEQHLHLTDEMVWTGYLTEYVRADHYKNLVEALRDMVELDDCSSPRMYIAATEQARTLLATLEAEKGGGV